MFDEFAIRQAIENWAVWRDQGNWQLFRTIWHPEGYMVATWFQGSAEEFIQASEQAWARGVIVHHFLGGTSVQIRETRAIAQTRMTISVRAPVHGILCDVNCIGCFFDFFEKVSGHWLLRLRQPIYEKDRLDPVNSSEKVSLDRSLLSRFPVGYQHLAYLQISAGQNVMESLPGSRGAGVERLYSEGAAWLAGSACP